MTTDRITKLTAADWIVTGNEVIAWVSGTEFFDIVFDSNTDRFALRINNAATAQTVFLGVSDSLSEAFGRANTHTASFAATQDVAAMFGIDPDNEPVDQFRCTHGRTMLEHCDECDD